MYAIFLVVSKVVMSSSATQDFTHVGGPVQGRPCLQAWHRAPGDTGRGAHPERLEHLAPPEVLSMKQGPEPVKKGPEPVKKAPCL